MAFVTFITPYKPIICGIADYSDFILKESPIGKWSVLSFNLVNYGVPLRSNPEPYTPLVRYTLPSRENFSSSSILKGLIPCEDQVLWFQHEFGIWKDSAAFSNMLGELDQIKVVTFHSLHFQNKETPYGLRRAEYLLLRAVLPYIDAITVFSEGVRRAVSEAFPSFSDKIYVLRHGIHFYPKVASMSLMEARAKIHNYLVEQSDLDQETKQALVEQRVFLDDKTMLIGGAGFITANKGIDLLYEARDMVQRMLPRKNISAVYIGSLREPDDERDGKCAAMLKAKYKRSDCFLLDTYLPAEMLPIFLKAVDVHFYWPSDCTQSGILAHSLGAGAITACRDMEGVGETVKMAGGLANADLGQLVSGIGQLLMDSALRKQISYRALKYATRFSWRRQALDHFAQAEMLCRSKVKRFTPSFSNRDYIRTTEESSTT